MVSRPERVVGLATMTAKATAKKFDLCFNDVDSNEHDGSVENLRHHQEPRSTFISTGSNSNQQREIDYLRQRDPMKEFFALVSYSQSPFLAFLYF